MRISDWSSDVCSSDLHAVRFVHQHHRAVLLGNGDHLLQWRDIAQHRIDALEDDELARFGGKPADALVQIPDAVVAKADGGGVPKIADVLDGGWGVGLGVGDVRTVGRSGGNGGGGKGKTEWV